jgi:hypothetical protein
MLKRFVAGYAGQCSFVLFTALSIVAIDARAQPFANADALLAIDQHRASVVERIVAAWGPTLAKSSESVSIDELRSRLLALRADQLFAATLAGTEDGLREVAGYATSKPSLAQAAHTKALGDAAADVVYTPVTPCRLVDTRGTFAAVYQGNGTASHTPVPFASNEIRTYTVQGGNGACLTQLPAGLNRSAVQLQVFGMPTTNISGDIEILPQGAAFGSTATMVYVASINFNTVSTAAKINSANNEISVQVRGGGANLAIDVVGYFAAPSGNGGKFFRQGGNAFGTTAQFGTVDNQPVTLLANNQPTITVLPNATSPNLLAGHPGNTVSESFSGQTIVGGGFAGNDCYEPATNTSTRSCTNAAGANQATIGGGDSNVVTGQGATIAGGEGNTGSGIDATVAGGGANRATGADSTVAGGDVNWASGNRSTVVGGEGNTASGSNSTVLGGQFNTASGVTSVAAGEGAIAAHAKSFVWNGWNVGSATSFRANAFQVHGESGLDIEYGSRRADGGGTSWVFIGNGFAGQAIATSTGAYLSTGGAWTNASDRNQKENFAPVDARDILARVAALPVTQWSYRSEPGVRRIGPVAQDFHAAFGLGSNDTTIATGDESGVALAAIQGLHQLMKEKDRNIEAQQRAIDREEHEIADLRNELDAMKRALSQLTAR